MGQASGTHSHSHTHIHIHIHMITNYCNISEYILLLPIDPSSIPRSPFAVGIDARSSDIDPRGCEEPRTWLSLA